VQNQGTAAGTVRLYPVDATTGQTSGAVYLAEADPRADVGAWTAVDGTPFTLNPGESRIVPVTITVPASPRSGQHLGGTVAEGAQTSGGTQVTIKTLTIMAVLMNLPAPFVERMTVPGIAPGGDQANPRLLLGLRNDGTMLLKPTGSITLSDTQGQRALQLPLALDTFVPQTQITYPLAIPPGTLPVGDYSATVILDYGNNQQTSRTLPLAFYYAPTLTGISPSSGSATGGNTVTLAGFGFGTPADTQVLIDGVALPAGQVTSVGARSITFIAPAHAAGTVTITVRAGGTLVSGSVGYQYGAVSALPGARPSGGTPGPIPPIPLPPARPAGSPLGQPGPLPPHR
jgi:hypothetical protein